MRALLVPHQVLGIALTQAATGAAVHVLLASTIGETVSTHRILKRSTPRNRRRLTSVARAT